MSRRKSLRLRGKEEGTIGTMPRIRANEGGGFGLGLCYAKCNFVPTQPCSNLSLITSDLAANATLREWPLLDERRQLALVSLHNVKRGSRVRRHG